MSVCVCPDCTVFKVLVDKCRVGWEAVYISKVIFRQSDTAYTSMDLRRDRKCSLKFREMLETQEYAQTQDAERRRQREAQSKRRYYVLLM